MTDCPRRQYNQKQYHQKQYHQKQYHQKTLMDTPLIFGADLSLLQHLEEHGVEYKQAGQAKAQLQLFKDAGCSMVRLRLFVDPSGKDGQVNTLPYTLTLARRVKDAGMSLLLDLHYSDGWADPIH